MTKPDWLNGDEVKDGYQLKWVGKAYAKAQSETPLNSAFIADTEHNKAPDNTASENLFFTGDNLEMLKHLCAAYKGAVKMIYIDPPYNTCSGGKIHKDRFEFTAAQLKTVLGFSEAEIKHLRSADKHNSHSAWLSFMYPRLKIAQELLREDGAIFISIDDNEQANLKLLCDEIFGGENYIGEIIRKTKSATNDKLTGLNYQHEFVLIYARNAARFSIVGDKKDLSNYKNLDNDQNGAWASTDPSSRSGSKNACFEIVNPETGTVDLPPKGRAWAFSRATFEKWVESGKIKFRREVPKGQRGFIVKKYLTELRSRYKLLDSLFGIDNCYMNQAATRELNALLTADAFLYPKPVAFIKRLIAAFTPFSEEETAPLILDFFAGSGTTAQAVIELNAEDGGQRRYILCQLPEKIKPRTSTQCLEYQTIDEVARARINLIAAKLSDKSGFRHYYIAPAGSPCALSLTQILQKAA